MDTQKLNEILPYPWTYSYLQRLNFDDSPTTYIMLARMLRKINELVAQGNNLQSIMEKLVEWINSQIDEVVREQMQKWLDNGTIKNIINEEIFGELNDKVNANTESINILNGVALSIETYPKQATDTSDSERIQRAIDYLNTLGGGTLNFPDGRYSIDKALLLYDNIALHGMSSVGTNFTVNGNYPFIKSYDITSRHDNMELSNMKIGRDGVDVNTPLLDFDHCSYTRLTNVNAYQFGSQQLNEGCVGLHFGSYSYYNVVTNCQFRQFHTGILCDGEANANVYVGGNCAYCGVYGVHIVKTNSQRFIAHAVEGGGDGVTAYYMEQKSLFNNFIGCRIESVGASYKAVFEANSQSSFNNLVVGGLDYSTNGAMFENISNFIVTSDSMIGLKNWRSRPSFKLVPASALTIPIGTPTTLNYTEVWYDRASNTSGNGFKVPSTGLYQFQIGANMTAAQTNGVTFVLVRNGTATMSAQALKGTDNNYTATFIDNFNENDTITAQIITTSAGNVSTGGHTSFFAGAIL